MREISSDYQTAVKEAEVFNLKCYKTTYWSSFTSECLFKPKKKSWNRSLIPIYVWYITVNFFSSFLL